MFILVRMNKGKSYYSELYKHNHRISMNVMEITIKEGFPEYMKNLKDLRLGWNLNSNHFN